MAKKDLQAATKAATAGMFTKKIQEEKSESVELKENSTATTVSATTTVTTKETNVAPAKEEKPKQQKSRKQANDYLYLDLRPAGGADLKSYVMEQAHRTSMEQGRNISATNYIQNLIKKDMDGIKDDSTKTKIISLLDNTTEEKLETIYTIIKNII